MQPAALTHMPPNKITSNKVLLGGDEGANHKDQNAGIIRINLPVGLSQRISLREFIRVSVKGLVSKIKTG